MIRRLARRFRRSESGSSTVEFVVVFPLIITVFMSMFEGAVMTVQQAMLERALDLTVRSLRLTTGTAPTRAQVASKVCEYTNVIRDCEDSIIIELTPVPVPAFTLPNADVPCVDRANDVIPQHGFTNGVGNQLMLIRACVVVDPLFPMTGLGLALTKDASGGYQIKTASAYVGEP